MRWTLVYDRKVTAYLYSLREDGYRLHSQIKQLQTIEHPAVTAIPLANQLDCYEIELERHWVSFQMTGNTLKILDIEPFI